MNEFVLKENYSIEWIMLDVLLWSESKWSLLLHNKIDSPCNQFFLEFVGWILGTLSICLSWDQLYIFQLWWWWYIAHELNFITYGTWKSWLYSYLSTTLWNEEFIMSPYSCTHIAICAKLEKNFKIFGNSYTMSIDYSINKIALEVGGRKGMNIYIILTNFSLMGNLFHGKYVRPHPL